MISSIIIVAAVNMPFFVNDVYELLPEAASVPSK